MSKTISHDAIATNTAAIDAFMSLSQVYLTGIERLCALNLNTARDAVETGSAATRSFLEGGASQDWNGLLSVMGQPVWEKTMAYSRRTVEIVAHTHEEMTKLIAGQFDQPQIAGSGLARWNAMTNLFAQGVQQMSTSAANSITAASGRAKAATAIAADQRKAA